MTSPSFPCCFLESTAQFPKRHIPNKLWGPQEMIHLPHSMSELTHRDIFQKLLCQFLTKFTSLVLLLWRSFSLNVEWWEGWPKLNFSYWRALFVLIPVNCEFTLLGYCITQVPKEPEGKCINFKKSVTCSLRTFCQSQNLSLRDYQRKIKLKFNWKITYSVHVLSVIVH